MLTVKGNAVKISQGDSYTIRVTITGALEEGCVATAGIAKKAGATPLWQLTVPIVNNIASFDLTETQTGVETGSYYWDVRIIYPDGSVKTVFTPASFQIVEVVSNVGG